MFYVSNFDSPPYLKTYDKEESILYITNIKICTEMVY